MKNVLDAIQAGASSEDIAALPIPESYRAAYVKRDEQAMFDDPARPVSEKTGNSETGHPQATPES